LLRDRLAIASSLLRYHFESAAQSLSSRSPIAARHYHCKSAARHYHCKSAAKS
jgi:hypothetical protein